MRYTVGDQRPTHEKVYISHTVTLYAIPRKYSYATNTLDSTSTTLLSPHLCFWFRVSVMIHTMWFTSCETSVLLKWEDRFRRMWEFIFLRRGMCVQFSFRCFGDEAWILRWCSWTGGFQGVCSDVVLTWNLFLFLTSLLISFILLFPVSNKLRHIFLIISIDNFSDVLAFLSRLHMWIFIPLEIDRADIAKFRRDLNFCSETIVDLARTLFFKISLWHFETSALAETWKI